MLKKTTSIIFCQLPRGTNSIDLTRSTGAMIKDTDILDIFEDSISEPYLPYILFQLGMLKESKVLDNSSKNHAPGATKSVYVLVAKKSYRDINPNEINRVIMNVIHENDPKRIGELFTTIIGAQYVLKSKKKFELDTIIVEGNTLEEIKEEKEKNGEFVSLKHRRGHRSGLTV